MKESLLICKAVAEVKAPDVEQVQGGLGNCEWPVWPECRVPGKLGQQGWDQVVEGHDCHGKEPIATRQQGSIRKILNKATT